MFSKIISTLMVEAPLINKLFFNQKIQFLPSIQKQTFVTRYLRISSNPLKSLRNLPYIVLMHIILPRKIFTEFLNTFFLFLHLRFLVVWKLSEDLNYLQSRLEFLDFMLNLLILLKHSLTLLYYYQSVNLTAIIQHLN